MKSRNLVLDLSKAIGIVLVVIGHFIPEGAPAWYEVFRQWIYGFHMPLFLFISGYVYWLYGRRPFADRETARVTYLVYAKGKFLRLFVPYIIFSVLSITMKLVAQGNAYVESPVTVMAYLRMFWQPEAGYLYWYVWSLLTFLLLVPLLKSRNSRLGALLVAICLHYFYVARWSYGYFSFCPALPQVLAIDQSCRMLIWFMLGVVIAERLVILCQGEPSLSRFFTNRMLLAVLLLFILVTLASAVDPAYDEGSLPALFLPYCGIAGVLSLAYLLSKLKAVTAALLPVGEAAFFIYLSHTIFMGLTKSLLFKFVPDLLDRHFELSVLIVVSIGLLLPMLIRYLLLRYVSSKLKI